MMTHKQRMVMSMQGELPEVLPYVPRLDLWYNANSASGTLPEKHQGRSQDEISRAEGWPLHKLVPEYLNVHRPEDSIHRALGIYHLKELVYRCQFTADIEIKVNHDGDLTHVEYHTPVGSVSTTTAYTEEMKKAGASITWIEKHAITGPEDYRPLEYIFENLEVIPDFDDFVRWKNSIGEDGVAATTSPGTICASPMHFIQKEFLDATQFYYHYHDFPMEMRGLAEKVENFFDRVLDVISDSPSEVVLWGANYDDMITYPEYFEREIMPWLRKVSERLSAKQKIMISHCDGENQGLMDLIKASGIQVAEAITPYPMTKVPIEEYYQRWGDEITLFGGIPEILLLEENATDDDLDDYLDHLFKVVAPGRRLILGIGDTTPAHAKFERLVRIGERVEKEGRLPLEGGAARPLSAATLAQAETRVGGDGIEDKEFKHIREDVIEGNHKGIKGHVMHMLDKGVDAQDILNRGMISAMEVISERFKSGEVFIPEVLLSARAMNEALQVLEPYLASDKKEASGKVLMATVRGDMHDIGKNMVITMLRGVGFEVEDMGINIPTEKIVERVSDSRPHILGLCALITTTMPEMRRVIEVIEAKGLRDTVKVMVGGAPVNEKYAMDIGADGYGADAGEAVDLAKKLMGNKI